MDVFPFIFAVAGFSIELTAVFVHAGMVNIAYTPDERRIGGFVHFETYVAIHRLWLAAGPELFKTIKTQHDYDTLKREFEAYMQ
jgi:hypothetical protein